MDLCARADHCNGSVDFKIISVAKEIPDSCFEGGSKPPHQQGIELIESLERVFCHARLDLEPFFFAGIIRFEGDGFGRFLMALEVTLGRRLELLAATRAATFSISLRSNLSRIIPRAVPSANSC